MTSRTTTPRRTSAVRPVDLSIRVTTPWSEGKNELEYTLDSPDSVLGRHQVRIAGPSFGTSADEFQKQVFEDLEALRSKRIEGSKLSTREVLGEAVDLGQELYRSLIPDPLKEYFRQARDKARTLLVTSDEYFMPWELLHDGEEFLCLRFRMGRWQAGGGAPGTALGIRRILGLSSFASNGPRDELGILRNLKASSEDLEAVLEDEVEFAALSEHLSSTPFDLFHFVGHGLHELGDHAKKPRILTADRPFHPTNVSNEIRSKLRREKPLVVLNACEVGRLGPALTGRKGWPDTFVGSGCSGFVAPSWSVATASAFQFASTLYPALRDGETLGDAVHAAREALRAEWTADLAWLAYTFYGHPNARVNFGRNAGPRDAAQHGS